MYSYSFYVGWNVLYYIKLGRDFFTSHLNLYNSFIAEEVRKGQVASYFILPAGIILLCQNSIQTNWWFYNPSFLVRFCKCCFVCEAKYIIFYFSFYYLVCWFMWKRKFSKVAVGDIGNYWYLFDTNVVFWLGVLFGFIIR